MMKVAFVRGSYLNAFEGQNYVFNDEIRLTGFSSLRPIHTRLPFPTVRLPSLADISSSRLWRALLNRMIGDRQNLWGLENFAGRFDIFHTADPHYFYSYQLARLRQRGLIKYLIATVWETVPFRNESVARKKKIKKYTLANTDLFLVHTARAKQALVAEGVAKEKIRFVRLGVDLRRFHPLEKAKKFAGKVLYVGRLVEEKGAVDAYEIFRSLPLNTVLTIVGDGPLKNRLETMIRRDGVADRVRIRKLAYEDMASVYRENDLLLFPSKQTSTWEEQYGMVLLEAMASGLPIFGYDSGAVGAVVGRAGALSRASRPDGLVKLIKAAVRGNGLKKLASFSRRRAEQLYDSRKTAKTIGTIYKEVANYERK